MLISYELESNSNNLDKNFIRKIKDLRKQADTTQRFNKKEFRMNIKLRLVGRRGYINKVNSIWVNKLIN